MLVFGVFFPFSFIFFSCKHSPFTFRSSGGKKMNSWKRIRIKFYRSESLGKVSLWGVHSSSKQVTDMRLRENSLQFPSLLQKWKIGVSEFLHVANLKCFSSGLPGLPEPVSPSLSGSQVELQAQSQVELPTTLTPAEHIVVFLPSTEPVKLLLQTGNKSDYHRGQQIPVTCSCCLNILP